MDYEKLGTRIGIEIHQELDCGKLFCGCSSAMEEKKKTFEVARKLRAVAGETGETDIAAQYEFLRDRNFVYLGYEGEACLVETDSEPPHPVNPIALSTAVSFAKLMKLSVPQYICVMRKTVTDGSAVGGFQRTMLAGTEGKDSILETADGHVKINQLNLEEDSCKIDRKEGDTIYYSLSRLGIPLLEIGTDASIKNPEQAKEAALLIGTMLRSFPAVKRGLGTIRQDVNVSIAGGARIEVKGWQDIRTLPKLVENEVARQVNLLDIKKELEARGLKAFRMDARDVTDVFGQTKNKVISGLLKQGGSVIALMLPKFAGILKREVCSGKTFGRELSEYAKAFGTKGMIHTDEDLDKYGLVTEFKAIRKLFAGKDEDLIVIIAERKEIAERAASSVHARAAYCLKGIPEETRTPDHRNAMSSYARPLPGAHRLYPETDILNIPISREYLESVEIPEPLPDRIEKMSKKYGFGPNMAKELIYDNVDIEALSKKYPRVGARQIAELYVSIPKDIKKRFAVEVDVAEHAEELLRRLNEGSMSRDGAVNALVELGKGNKVDYSRFSVMDDATLRKEIKKIISENKGLAMNAMIGKVMEKLRGKADGAKIVSIVRECS